MLIQDFNPNIRELAENILLGPQAEVVEKIDTYNRTYLHRFPEVKPLKCTKTFRWSPGSFDSVCAMVEKNILQWNKRGNISKIFDRRDNNSWNWNRMKEQVIEIDSMMARLRREGVTFQDNTDLLQEKFISLQDTISHQLTAFNNFISNQSNPSEISVSIGSHREEPLNNEWSKYEIMINLKLKDVIIPVYNVNTHIGDIPFEDLEMRLYVKLNRYLNQLCIRPIGEMANMYAALGCEGTHEIVRTTDDPRLSFPYISRPWSNGTSNGWFHACLGDYQTHISNAALRMDFVALYTHFRSWCRYNIPGTRPLNNIRLALYGIPGHYSETFKHSVGQDTERCARRLWRHVGGTNDSYENILAPENNETKAALNDYCDDIECQLRNRCDRYMEDPIITDEELTVTSGHETSIVSEADIEPTPPPEGTETPLTPTQQQQRQEIHDRIRADLDRHIEDTVGERTFTVDEEMAEEVVAQRVAEHEANNSNNQPEDDDTPHGTPSREQIAERMQWWADTHGTRRILNLQQQEGDTNNG
jgi:hypothetical protein